MSTTDIDRPYRPAYQIAPAATDRRRVDRRQALVRHLRAALTGTLLAVVAVTGLSSYAAQGVADARQSALCQARTSCK